MGSRGDPEYKQSCPASVGGTAGIFEWSPLNGILSGFAPGERVGGGRGQAGSARTGDAHGNDGSNGGQCTGRDGGVIVTTGAGVEAGVAAAGVSVQANVGYGLFYDGGADLSGDHVLSGAAAVYAGHKVRSLPGQRNYPVVAGAYAGASLLTVTVTNGHSAQQVAGPFQTYSLNVGTGPSGFSIQFARGGRIWEVSVTAKGPSAGISVSSVTTTTTVESAAAGCK